MIIMIINYGIKKIKTIPALLFKELYNSLPYEQRLKISFKINKHDREISLISQIILRFALNKDFGIKYKELDLCKTESGKPYIRNHDSIHFNISHSGNWVVLVFSDEEIGIDIERETDINLDIAQTCFSKDEYRYLINLCNNTQKSAFYKIWTLKESYVKALGLGLNKSLDSFTVTFGKDKIALYDAETGNRNFIWKLQHSIIDSKYHLSLCYHKSEAITPIYYIKMENLLSEYLSSIC